MMKRQKQNRNNRESNRRNLRIESLEDRRLLTVAAELAPMPQQMERGSDHLPSVAEIAVEKATDGRLGLHNNGAYRDPASIQAFGEKGFSHQPDSVIILEDDVWIAVEKIAVEKIAVEKLFNRMGLQNRNSVMDPTDCPNVIDGLESAGIEADQSAGRMFEDGTSEAADGDSEAATDSIPGGNDDALDSLMADDDDRTGEGNRWQSRSCAIYGRCHQACTGDSNIRCRGRWHGRQHQAGDLRVTV